jgi:hypothetical protein
MKNLFTLKNLGWLLTLVATVMFGMSAFSKVTGSEEMVIGFEFMKLLPYMKWIGLGEIVGLALLIYPRTSIYGAVLLSSFMSGAVALHMSYMDISTIASPIMFGVLAWTSHCLRTYTK